MTANPIKRSPQEDRPNRPVSFQKFPDIPDGVVITPFKDFKECGIQSALGPDGIERDHLGIPTVELHFKHDTDVSKTKPDSPMGHVKARWPATFKKEWWIEMEQDEHLRMHGPYDHGLPPVVLLRRAAGDFQKYRRFPADVFRPLWELTFKIYAGITGQTPVWHKADEQADDDEKDASDDDFEEVRKFPAPLRPREPYALYGVQPPIVENNEQIQELLDAARQERDARAERFLADPATAIQIYLSSYMYYQGLMWSNRNLVNAPHLLRFFVEFLLRNQVLPDPRSQAGLKRALNILEVAGTALPLTSKIAKALPDAFSEACQACWGSSAQGYAVGGGADSAAGMLEASVNSENIEGEALGSDADPDVGGWDADAAPPPVTDWGLSAPESLLALLGPMALTHAPGAISIHPSRPRPSPNPNPLAAVAAVEHGLRAQMHRVELGPWAGWDADGSAYAVPAVLRASSDSSAHTPHSVEDTITLLVEPAAAAHLRVGMGLGGVWVQLRARSKNTEDASESTEEEEEEGCAGTERGDLWCAEKLEHVITSYWIPRT
ncbi:hypothetical protein FB451DRAFT_1367229 [Mycena latifolia]|nr:hypothetical protein FB451DRAFT_1367229 [Mycena latifolia]